MRIFPLIILSSVLALSACGGGDSASGQPRLVVEPDDGRGPILEAIASATDNIRLTIYEITDLEGVAQDPSAPADSVVRALVDKARSGVSVRVIVDQRQYSGTGSTSLQIQRTVDALRHAGAIVHPSSNAFCVTHQKTFVIDGPTADNPSLFGKAIIMSLNLLPGYFSTTRDYGVITSDPGVVREIGSVFDSDFALVNPSSACSPAYSPTRTSPPPSSDDTPFVNESDLLWSPVNSKPKLLQLIGNAKQSLELTTEELGDDDMVCQIQALAQSPTKPSVRILLADDTGTSASAVRTLLGLGLANLSIRVMPGQPSPPDPTHQTPLYMHGKQVIADGVQAFVGSENLTNTSLIQNRELGTLFTDQGMIARLHSVFESDFTTPGNSLAAQACTGGEGCVTIACHTQP